MKCFSLTQVTNNLKKIWTLGSSLFGSLSIFHFLLLNFWVLSQSSYGILSTSSISLWIELPVALGDVPFFPLCKFSLQCVSTYPVWGMSSYAHFLVIAFLAAVTQIQYCTSHGDLGSKYFQQFIFFKLFSKTKKSYFASLFILCWVIL